MASRGWFNLGFVANKHLVIMMAIFRFSRPFRMLLLISLETFLVSHFSTSSAGLEVSLIKTACGAFYRHVSLGAVFLAFLLSSVRLSSSYPVFLSLF